MRGRWLGKFFAVAVAVTVLVTGLGFADCLAGHSTTCGNDTIPTRTVPAVSAGWTHTVGLKSDGTVVAIGDNDYGQCDVVSFLDGYVQKGLSPGNTITCGSEYVFNSAITQYISAAALSSTKFVVTYQDYDNSRYGTAVIGDVSGNTITYGPEYVFNPAATADASVAALSSSKFVVVYQDIENSKYGTAVIGEVSGNIITYGPEYVFNPANTWHISIAVLSSNKFVVVYHDVGNYGYGTAVIGDVTGNTITHGPEYVFNPAESFFISAVTISSAKFVVAYQDYDNSIYGTAVIGEVSGNTITYGAEYVFNPAATFYISAAALSSTKFVVTYWDMGNSNYGKAIFGDVSGNTITYGLECVFNSAITQYISAAVLSSSKFAVVYRDIGNSRYGTVVIGEVSGNTITYGAEYVFNPAATFYISAAALSSTKFVVVYHDVGNYGYGTAVIGDTAPIEYLPGDANEDNVINIFDITKVTRIILELDNPTPSADANQDGSINVYDMTRIARMILGLD